MFNLNTCTRGLMLAVLAMWLHPATATEFNGSGSIIYVPVRVETVKLADGRVIERAHHSWTIE